MPLIKVIKNETEFHLEVWNEQAIIQLGLPYEIVPIDKDFILSTIEDIKNSLTQ
jgi:hypothetical protein